MKIVIASVLIALNGGAVVARSVILQLVGLVPVRGDPRDIFLINSQSFDVGTFTAPHVFIIDMDVNASMDHLDHGMGVTVIVNGTVVTNRPYL